MGFYHYRPFTIDHTKVPNTDLTNYPVLISGTYSYLKSVANGGRVNNASGFDIRPFSDTGLTTALSYFLVSYDGSTGTVCMIVKVPTLSHTTDYAIQLAYGDPTITTDGSSSSALDSNFKTFIPLGNGSSLSLIDKSSNSNSGTNIGSATATAGPIAGAGGIAVNGTSQGFSIANLSSVGDFTVSVWAYLDSSSATTRPVFWFDNFATSPRVVGGFHISRGSDNTAGAIEGGDGTVDNQTTFTRPSLNAWHLYHLVRSGSTLSLYADGSSTAIASITMNSATITLSNIRFGTHFYSGADNEFFSGKIGPVSLALTARSADWRATEYNNASSPSTFYSVGSETQLGTALAFGPTAAGTGADDTAIGTRTWIDTTEIYASNDVWASVVGPGQSHYLKATNFGFTIPTNAVIDGLEAVVEKHVSGGTITESSVKFYKAGSPVGNDLASKTWANTTDDANTYGGATELAGLGWSPSDINNSGFGIGVSVTVPSLRTAYVDLITIKVYYRSLGNNYTLSMAQGTFAVSGQALALRHGYKATLAQGSFALTGQSMTPKRGVRLATSQGSFALSGQSLALSHGYKITLGQGSFTLNGQNLAFKRALKTAMGQGSFALSGQAATIYFGHIFPMANGSFTVSGQNLSFSSTRRLAAATGAFALNGQNAGLLRGVRLALANGSFSLNGQSISTAVTRFLGLAKGNFTVNGQALTLKRGLKMSLSNGNFALTMQNVVTYFGHILPLSSGIFTVSGQNLGLKAAHTVALQRGNFALTGQAAILSHGYKLAANQGTFTVTGQPLTLKAQHNIALGTGNFTLTGRTAGVLAGRLLTAQKGNFTVTGQSITLTRTLKFSLSQGSFVLNGQPVSLKAARTVAAQTGSFALTGGSLAMHAGKYIAAASASFSLSGQAMNTEVARYLSLARGDFELTGNGVFLSYFRQVRPPLSLNVSSGHNSMTVGSGIRTLKL